MNGALRRPERRHAAIGPSKRLGTIVRGEDDYGVVRLALRLPHCMWSEWHITAQAVCEGLSAAGTTRKCPHGDE
jgi:hypothetical protein